MSQTGALNIKSLGKTLTKGSNVKMIIYIAVGIVVIVALFYVIKTIKGIFVGGEKAIEEATAQGRADDYSQSKLSKTKADLDQRYLNIFNSMNRWGTDEDEIFRNFEGLNKDDILYLKNRFGTKPYSDGVLASNYVTQKFFSKDLDLNGWLKEELSKRDAEKMRAIYAEQGLTF